MKKASLAMLALAGVAFWISGCGKSEVKSVPDTVATVNGEKITSAKYLDESQRRIGQDVLRNMIEQQIMVQWAKDEGVEVTSKQVDDQIKVLKREGIYKDRLKMMGEDALKSELEAMQARINVAKKLNKPSDEDAQAIYDQMVNRYVHGPRKYVAVIISSKKDKLEKARKEAKGGKDFEQLAAIYADSAYASQGAIKIWVEDNQKNMPPVILDATKDAKVGDVSEVFNVAQQGQQSQFGILKVLDSQPKSDLAMKDVKDEVAGLAALQKTQADPEFQNKLNEKKKAAKIEINIKDFENIALSFKNPPEPNPMMGMMKPGPAPKTKAAQPAK